jgi:hypothetical protein
LNNVPKSHDNTRTRDFLTGYLSVHELCEDHPPIDDIFSGVLALRTAGVTSTRSLSRQVLFHILQQCKAINVSSVTASTLVPYAYRTLTAYASLARVASKAIAGFIETLGEGKAELSLGCARAVIDAPYADELARAVAASLEWKPAFKTATYKEHPGEDDFSGLALLRGFAQAELLELA